MPACDALRASPKRPAFFSKLRSAVLLRFDVPFRGEAGIERNRGQGSTSGVVFSVEAMLASQSGIWN